MAFRSSVTTVACASLVGLLALRAPDARAISCDEVSNMVSVNVPEDIVIQTMRDSGTTFTEADVACLQKAGVSQRVGCVGVPLHSLHHSHVFRLIDAGVDAATSSKRIGHASPAIALASLRTSVPQGRRHGRHGGRRGHGINARKLISSRRPGSSAAFGGASLFVLSQQCANPLNSFAWRGGRVV